MQTYGPLITPQNICCPVATECYRTDFSISGIWCCANADQALCEQSLDRSAICLESTSQCGLEDGGGCCPMNAKCSVDGCLVEVHGSATNESPDKTSDGVSNPAGPKATATTFKVGEMARESLGTKGMQCKLGFWSNPGLREVVLGIAFVISWLMIAHV